MNEKIIKQIEKAKDYLIIVEGKKDKFALQRLGFKKIFVIHETGKSLGEKIEQIQEIVGKDKVCILTDFDKKGKQMYFLLKSKLQEIGVRMDNTFRGFLLKQKISHIEGLDHFINKEEGHGWKKHKKHR
jgi:5S rRNA maturation endonuclease (ribonuclease M5)